ncbi:uncharacterized protein LOC111262953 isoform X2 [Varroa jacobsoni]|uniref:Uncharacterized protein n=1 Tax=Varroa destructor TaxID=109461 RepID=A0A7M7L668_VARDE|nr:uncharacterized protein LOC111254503 isoform X2 [Varroa destructor]XP_022671146.1 uncharacterized protein LOC111254503 isoform X2 [Varroa destructor]XP_022693345.1 uncharacterized protein LOC111262953 isoform X2 [Varroa jacobsoni]XP_022693355.1 uncharacterized protein LOC111262953 isoform X2 [Varroa jacobsoni]
MMRESAPSPLDWFGDHRCGCMRTTNNRYICCGGVCNANGSWLTSTGCVRVTAAIVCLASASITMTMVLQSTKQDLQVYKRCLVLLECCCDTAIADGISSGQRLPTRSFQSPKQACSTKMDSYGEDYQSSSYEDDEEYLQAQFSAEYDSVASERLHAMSKPELVHEYLLLEARIDELEEELKAVKKAEESDQPMEVQATEEDIAKITVFQQEISKLQAENRRLIQENDHLRQQTI